MRSQNQLSALVATRVATLNVGTMTGRGGEIVELMKDGRNPLHYAAASRKSDELYNYLQNKVDDAQDKDNLGKTASHYMKHPSQLSGLRKEVDKNAETQRKRKPQNSKKNSPIHKTPTKRDGLNITGANIRIWIHDEDLPKLEKIVWEGQGHRLMNETSNNPRVRQFLKLVPRLMTKIKEVHLAPVSGDLDALETKVDNPDILIAKDHNGLNPLHRSAALGHYGICKWIVNKNPSTVHGTDKNGRSPLHYATIPTDGGDIYNLLVKYGADVTLQDHSHRSPDDYRGRPGEIDKSVVYEPPSAPRIGGGLGDYRTPKGGSNATSRATSPRNRSRDRLGRRRSEPSLKNRNMRKSKKEKIKFIDMQHVTEKEIDEMIQDGDMEKLENLILSGRGHELRGKSSWNDDVRKFLKNSPAYSEKIFALQDAANAANFKEVKKMLAENPKLAMGRTIDGEVALHFAAKAGSEDIANYLLEIYPDGLHVQDRDNRLPSHWAAMSSEPGSHIIYSLLEKTGADVNARDINDRSALDYYEEVTGMNGASDPSEDSPSTLENGTLSPLTSSLTPGEISLDDDTEKSATRSRSKDRSLSRSKDTSRSKSKDTSRSKSKDRSRSKSKTRSRSKSKNKSRSKSTNRSRSKSKNRSRSKSLSSSSSRSKSQSNENKSRSRSQSSKSKSRKNSKSPSISRAPTEEAKEDSAAESPTESRPESHKETSPNAENVESKSKNSSPNNSGENSRKNSTSSTDSDYNQGMDQVYKDAIKTAENGDFKSLKHMVLTGAAEKLVGARSADDAVQHFLDEIPNYTNSLNKLQKAVQDGDLRTFMNELDRKEKAEVKDSNGSNLLHLAVLNGHTDIVRYLLENYAHLLNEADLAGRTPLHYAAVIRDGGHLYKVLEKGGADKDTKDASGYTPEDYIENPDFLSQKELFEELDEGKKARNEDHNNEDVGNKETRSTEKQTENNDDTENSESINEEKENNDIVEPNDSGNAQIEQEGMESNESNQVPANNVISIIRKGDLDELNKLLEEDPTIEKFRSKNNGCLLHVATAFGQAEIVQHLLEKYPDMMQDTDMNGRTSMHYAAVIRDGGYIYQMLELRNGDAHQTDNLNNSPDTYLHHQNLLSQQEIIDEFDDGETPSQLNEIGNIQNEESDHGMEYTLTVQEDAEAVSKDAKPSSSSSSVANDNVEIPGMWTEEGKYLSEAFGDTLVKALAIVNDKRPANPISELAVVLYALKFIPQKSQHNKETEDEHPGSGSSTDSTIARKAAFGSQVNNISNIEVDSLNLDLVTSQGENILHFAAGVPHADTVFYRLIAASKASLAARNANYQTPRDVAFRIKLFDNVGEIDDWILHLAADGQTKLLGNLVLEGYDAFFEVEDIEGNNIIQVAGISKQTAAEKYLQTVPEFEEKKLFLHKAIRIGSLPHVQFIDENEDICSAKDLKSRTSLHIAVLCEQLEIISHLCMKYPKLMQIQDNVGRTPLHYAMAVEGAEEVTKVLVQSGADKTIKDYAGNLPNYYFMHRKDIALMANDIHKDDETN